MNSENNIRQFHDDAVFVDAHHVVSHTESKISTHDVVLQIGVQPASLEVRPP